MLGSVGGRAEVEDVVAVEGEGDTEGAGLVVEAEGLRQVAVLGQRLSLWRRT